MKSICDHCSKSIPQNCDGRVYMADGKRVCRGTHPRHFTRNWCGELMFWIVKDGRRRCVKPILQN